jgi:hypothetical protein
MSAASDDKLLTAFERHSPEQIRATIDAGIDLHAPIREKLPVNWLVEMYTRSDRFPECLRILLERGAVLDDPVIAPILLDDVEALREAVRASPSLVKHRTSMVSAFTPLIGASLLHVAAEFGHFRVAQALVEMGADVDARAGVDEFGFNGHTPLFHTVNSNGNRSAPILRLLLDAGAASDLRLEGITWGKGFDWETVFFDVSPISYAQYGLLPQMHRIEGDIYENITLLLKASGRVFPPPANVPNRYLTPKA